MKNYETLKQETEMKKTNVHDKASELYNELLEIYYDEHCYLSHAKRKKMNRKYKPKKLFIKGYNYSMWSKHKDISSFNEESLDLSVMPPL